MSWLNLLYETYENLSAARDAGAEDPDTGAHLYPIGHTTQLAQIELTINARSEFVAARVLEKPERTTLVPCTEASASRGGTNPPPHPLFDKLQYVAGDYARLGGKKGEKFHEAYMRGLRDWAESPYATDKLRAVAAYLEKGTLMRNLVDCGVLPLGADGRVPDQWTDPDIPAPAIYKAVAGSPNDAFVRFRVTGLGPPDALWQDTGLQKQYVAYLAAGQGAPALCYATGDRLPPATSHPYKIRNSGDKAKLISANDNSGFTYRGRFTKPEQAAQVGFVVTQEAHNALKYLIEKQGRRFGSRVYVTWNPGSKPLPDPFAGADELDTPEADESLEDTPALDTGRDIAGRVSKMLAGYQADLTYRDLAVIMGVDAATTGRLAVVYYYEGLANALIDNLKRWQTDCGWRHSYRFVPKEEAAKYGGKTRLDFFGAPSPKDIALAAYGREQNGLMKIDDKLLAETVGRILPCIAEGAAFPRDIAEAAFRRLCRPQSYSRNHWLKNLSICCSLTKKVRLEQQPNTKEDWNMIAEKKLPDIPDLSYLYGRWLAVADAAERSTFEKTEAGRETNAERYFARFAVRPQLTMELIRPKLTPYLIKIGKTNYAFRRRYEDLLSEISAEIAALLAEDPAQGSRPLGAMMALGYDGQRQEIYAAKEPGAAGKDPDPAQTLTKEEN